MKKYKPPEARLSESGYYVWSAICTVCRHKWTAIVEAGDYIPSLECPKCHNIAGEKNENN